LQEEGLGEGGKEGGVDLGWMGRRAWRHEDLVDLG
jgi:hypothetical protein